MSQESSETQPIISKRLKIAMETVDKKMTAMPFVYIFLRVWGTLRALLDYTDGYKLMPHTVYMILYYLQVEHCFEMNAATVSSRFEERKISEPGWDVLNVSLGSHRTRSCQIGLYTYFQKGFKKSLTFKFSLACS